MLTRVLPFLLAVALLSTSAFAESQSSDRQLARRIVAQLREAKKDGRLKRLDLDMTVRNGNVTVTGRIEDSSESRLILDSIISESGVHGIQMNLGVGRAPATAFVSQHPSGPWPPIGRSSETGLRNRPLRWDDGYWQLDFGTPPAAAKRGRTEQAKLNPLP